MSQDKFLLTRKHILAARGILEMTQDDLADAAGMSRKALYDIESGKSLPRRSTLEKIREAFERRGVEFTNGNNPGVRLNGAKAVIPV